jgi:hypothetical protein
MAKLYSLDRAITCVQQHNSGIRDVQGHDVTAWVVHFDPQRIAPDDIMEKLTTVSEVLRIVYWQPGTLFVIRKPTLPPITALELRPLSLVEPRTVSGRHT